MLAAHYNRHDAELAPGRFYPDDGTPPDYAVQISDGPILVAVERKTLDNLAATLSDGTPAFQMQRLADLPLAAVIIEARSSAVHKLEHVDGNWLADQLARLEVHYPEVHLAFADSRRYAEGSRLYRLVTTALADTAEPNPHSNPTTEGKVQARIRTLPGHLLVPAPAPLPTTRAVDRHQLKPMISNQGSHPEWCVGSQDHGGLSLLGAAAAADRGCGAARVGARRAGRFAAGAAGGSGCRKVGGRASFCSPRYVAYALTVVLPSLRARWI